MREYKIATALALLISTSSVTRASEIANAGDGVHLIQTAENLTSTTTSKAWTQEQIWVMDQAKMGNKWQPEIWQAELGDPVAVPLDAGRNMNPEIIKNFYFSSADMTVEVNVLKREIVTAWIGRTTTVSPSTPGYEILQDETSFPWKRSVTVELDKPVDEKELKRIAEGIHAQNTSGLKKTFIAYYLKGSSLDQAAWAVTNYDPELKVEILGATASQLKEISSSKAPDGEILGRWAVTFGVTSISLRAGKPIATTIFTDGSTRVEKLKAHNSSRGKRFDVLNNDFGEYYVILRDGRLESGDQEGLLSVSPPVD